MHPLPLCIAAFAWTLLGTSCQSSPAPHDDPAAAGPTQVQVVRLEHGQATELAATLRHLLEDGHSDVRIAAVPGQNTLALAGSRASLQTALELVARLDVAPHERQAGEASIIYLKHVAAGDMAETLQQFLSESGQDLEITPHADSNSLLVRASGERWQQLATLIDKLDQPQR